MGIIIGDTIVTDSATIEAGTYTQGAILGRVDASGVLKLCAKKDADNNDVTDGSQAPYAVLLENVETTQDTSVPVLLFGEVDSSAISFGNGWEASAIRAELRKIGIFTKGVIDG